MKKHPLLITGASARAAAFSAARSGYAPYWIDQFGDQDLAAAFPGAAVRLSDYPQGVIEKLKTVPVMPWLYTGAMENHLDVIDEISKTHPLLGNGRKVCQDVRDAEKLSDCFKKAGVYFPETIPTVDNITRDKSYLLKPRRSGGGLGICVYSGEGPVPDGYVLQERVEGESCSAVFIGNGERAILAGVTRQLVGMKEFNAAPFAYCGSIGPLRLNGMERIRWQTIGDVLVEKFGLSGLFGVDAVNRSGNIIPIEVNPRYTASVEIVELALDLKLIRMHIEACMGVIPRIPGIAGHFIGKAILFAPYDLAFNIEYVKLAGCIDLDTLNLADIPQEGSVIRTGHPVLTLLAGGDDIFRLRRALSDKARLVFESFTRRQGPD